ncbi:DUF2339 domain-containing protein [Mycolicibacillus trivialis]|uniref:DUF2339 domain-containing protein n=1 Tax=Mycolicibacillus trivialis TaxID=1798 RepID=UPI0021F29072|nr:DUF2339 domain-containing protein [Mycolicibacillus trivialis]
MTASSRRVLAGVVAELDVMTYRLSQIRGQLAELEQGPEPSVAAPTPAPPAASPAPTAPALPAPPVPPAPRPRAPRDSSWIGKLLAVAGVAVTLIGVVLLLVLAAQAGLLRPEIRVLGGAALASALVGAAIWWQSRPGGRIGAIALAATGIAAGYLDVLAVTAVYEWAPAAVGLVLAAVVAAGGLVLARRWDSEQLALLVVVPLIGLAPVLTDGIDLLLVGFMLTLSAAVLPVQLDRDWVGMHAARIAAATVPLLFALLAGSGAGPATWPLAACCGLAGCSPAPVPARPPGRSRRAAASPRCWRSATVPVLAAGVAVGPVAAALMAAGLAAAMLAVVLLGAQLPAVARQVFAALSAVAALIAVTVGFDGPVAVPVLLGLGVVVALGGHRDVSARWAAAGFGVAGTLGLLALAPPSVVTVPTRLPVAEAVSVLVSSVLLIGWTAALGWAFRWAARPAGDGARAAGVCAGALAIYAVTVFTVTAGVLAFGTGGGFLGGHVAATLCWVAIAAGLFGYALRAPDRQARDTAVGAGLALTGTAMAKLFLFDLGTLDGMFRVAVFLVAGLVLLGMGAGYARSLTRQDRIRS